MSQTPKFTLSNRLSRLKPSPTLQLAARARELKEQGIDVLDFSGGEPDFRTPEEVGEAAIKAIRDGFTKYTAVGGISELKEAIVAKFERDQKITYTPKDIVVSCGAKHSLFQIFQALVNPGDQVLLPSPAWVSYPDQIYLNGGEPVFVPCREEDGFRLTPEAVEAAITPRSRILVLNSPNNPTGAVIGQRALEGIGELALKHNLLIISDEIYEKIVYDNHRSISIATLDPRLKESTIIVNGVSKTYSMTGWRIGYAAGPREIMQAVDSIQSQTTSNPTSISQKAAAFALSSGDRFFLPMLSAYGKRREAVVEALNQVPGITCKKPDGAFYAFLNISGLLGKSYRGHPLLNVYELAEFFLDVAKVTIVPGAPFGNDHHMRMSFAASLSVLQAGIERIRDAVSRMD
ncbi:MULTISPECIES: pyridoxal phosphate-dependent aminotransferase [Leptospirillum]|jgi:aspartate aminotransferase|uniref:Aminotransferase n=3 Tax=Leptospirillum ferriphilum TaxID=178606 RepID=A0A059XYX1_9BACT|nr:MULTISPECIES: pyridoxal phosphate-dependent aminotransferase [Leptospirillum]EAY56261.1 MAG: Aspartate aminotransferase [Leptospirillum rubarum]EIJ75737.1 MAG: Aspartate aminotransferase [Leptospirillum sp. Group II 'C75']AFS53494.1 aspartate/tyrosine/aromatic aminotransferase [Leptospirillum ferriphilum ML-04]AIA30496.1 aspartate aminotransferase [Leptospirillum ferriphilum YSK]AKS23570.1 aspartate aminotransferase [Leptospirillum sp. Group II 'CF-1']